MNTALFTSVFGSRVRLRPAKDAFESQYGVMVEFLDEDGSIRDFEGLERVDALMAALYLSTLATEGLSDVAEVSSLYNDAFQRLDGCMVPAGIRPANLISFPTPGAVTSSLSTASGNAGGELFTPPPAGENRGLESPRSIAQTGMPASPVGEPAL